VAVEFASNTNYVLKLNSAVVTAKPLTMACWVYWTLDDDTGHTCMSLTNSGNGNQYHDLGINAAAAPATARARSSTSAGSVAASTPGVQLNTWHHICGVYDTVSPYIRVYLDGGGEATNTTNRAPTIDWSAIGGRRTNTSITDLLTGRVAEAAWWSAALTAAEVAMLAKGFSPLMVRRASLAAYLPLLPPPSTGQNVLNFIDVVGGRVFQPTNRPPDAPHAPVARPRGVWAPRPGTAAVPDIGLGWHVLTSQRVREPLHVAAY
jgi:hypothetical protein